MWRNAPALERHRWLPPLASSPPFFIKTLLLYFCTSKAAATQQSWWACKIASIPPYSPLSPQQPKGYWQCVVCVVWWPLLLLRRLIVFILSQFFSFLTPFFTSFLPFLPFIQFFYCTSSQNESVYNNHTMNECENNEKMANRVVKSPPIEWMEEIARKMCKFATF